LPLAALLLCLLMMVISKFMGCKKLRRQNVIWNTTWTTNADRLRWLNTPKGLTFMHVACHVIAHVHKNIYRSYEIAKSEIMYNRYLQPYLDRHD
jgi:hypothetical protein